MRKYILGLLVLVVIVGVSFWLYTRDGVDNNSDKIKELEEVLNATSTSPLSDKPIIKIEPIVDEVDPNIFYNGQAIDESGGDSLLDRISKEALDTYVNELNRLKEVLEKDPLDVESWVRLGQIKKVFNNYAGARDAWEYVKYIIKPDALLNYNLANLYGFDLKDSEKAITYYEEALKLDPDNYDYVIGVIDFYRTLDNKKSRIEELIQKAISLNPNDVSLMAYIGRYYQDIGDKNKAIEYYEKALEIEPNNEFIKSDLERLRK